jgi:hypothetical protein
MPNPAAWFSQGEPDTQSVTCFVDPTTGAQNVVHSQQPLPVAVGAGPVTSLSAVTTGNGTALNGGCPHNNHTMVATTSAGVSAGAVQLQGSMDNVNWVSLGSPLTTAVASTTTAQTQSAQPWQYIRAVVTTTIVGGTITVLVASS